MMQLVHHMKQSDLARWGYNALSHKCQHEDLDCIKSHATLINVVGQVKSPESQRVIINAVMRMNPSEGDMKRAIFHLSSQEHPIPVNIFLYDILLWMFRNIY